ncbi:putative RNA-directed DNA polymerase from transposon BS [Trichonephila clavipes]|nr:putative RNA-directed DNA polymerase from transposon BS [Trichonephila clavipes]
MKNNISTLSPFAIHKALTGIGAEPKSVKRVQFGDLLIETISTVQSKTFLLAKSFLNFPVTVSPHKSLSYSQSVISGPDLLYTPEAEILEGFSEQGAIQDRRIIIKNDAPTTSKKHLIIIFNSPVPPKLLKLDI